MKFLVLNFIMKLEVQVKFYPRAGIEPSRVFYWEKKMKRNLNQLSMKTFIIKNIKEL